jgi:hypothetical protein
VEAPGAPVDGVAHQYVEPAPVADAGFDGGSYGVLVD